MSLLAFAETIQLFPDGSLFIHIALILIMIWFLNRTLYKPLNRVLESRERNKGGRSSEAEQILSQVMEKETRYAGELRDARAEGYELIERENGKLTTAREQKLSAAKAELAAKLTSEREALEKQKADVREAIGSEAEKMADKIASNILGA